MSENKTYWKSVDQLDDQNEMVQKLAHNEFTEQLPVNEFLSDQEGLEDSATSRRDFLKYVGFSTAAATLAACEGPVIKSVPYVVQPEQIIPGIANYYATTIADGFDFASVLVKTREGRPIKIENNTDAPAFGTANARVHASVLSLYDTQRLQGPKATGEEISWDDLKLQVGAKLKALSATGKPVVLLTQTLASPTTQQIINDFIAAYPNVKQVVYDTVSCSEALDAFANVYGQHALASYDFSQVETLVSVGADILGDWQGGGNEGSYAQSRVPHGKHGAATMSHHIQFEANMTLSGANADVRVPATPAVQRQILAHIYAELTNTPINGTLPAEVAEAVSKAVARLRAAKDKGVVVCGIEDVGAQKLTLALNQWLGSKAFQPHKPLMHRQGDSQQVNQALEDILAGKVGGLITLGVNPVHTTSHGAELAEAIKKLDLSVVFSTKEDETSIAAQYIAALPHYLEAWGDYQITAGHY